MTTVLVTGATGTVGSRVVGELREAGVPVRAFVRDPERARAILGPDVELAVGEFQDLGTIEMALKDAEQVFLASPNHPRQFDHETRVIDAAARAGVERIVKLSALGAEPGCPLDFWDAHGRIEVHLDRAGIPAVVLRPTFYMSNILASVEAVKQTGHLFLPAAGTRVAMVCPNDVAAAAAAIFAGAGVDDARPYRLTGPEAITFTTVAEQLSVAIGYPVEEIDVSDEAARQAMVGAGIPEWTALNLVTLFGFLRRGVQDGTTNDVRELTGRNPRSFGSFAQSVAPLFTR